jgi:hypothetical protein
MMLYTLSVYPRGRLIDPYPLKKFQNDFVPSADF